MNAWISRFLRERRATISNSILQVAVVEGLSARGIRDAKKVGQDTNHASRVIVPLLDWTALKAWEVYVMNRPNSDAEGCGAELEKAGCVWSAFHAVELLAVIAGDRVGMENLRNGIRFRRFALPVFFGLGLLLAGWVAQAQGTGLQAQIPAAEYNALVDLYNAANGPSWANSSGWINPQAESWYGVTVVGGHVTQLALGGNMLSGNIPDSLGDLSQLQSLDLYNNTLGGNIPASLGSLTQLRDLGLCFNQLIGNIPGSLGNLSQLQHLNSNGTN